MKHFGISIIVLFFSLQLFGQNTIVYSYDLAGNRILRDTTSVSISLMNTELDGEQELAHARQSPEAPARDAVANSNPGLYNGYLPKFVLPFDYFYTPAYRANDAFRGPVVSAYK